jgi:LacI family transcriptional regulator
LHELSNKTTINDIARKLQINAATVSRALNDHPAISEETKKKVRALARRMNYHPNQIASSLRLGTSRILGVIIPSAEIHFFGSVIHGIERVAAEHDYNVIIYQSNELLAYEQKGIETFLRSRVDGVLASMAKETTSFTHFQELKKRGVPLVLFDRTNDAIPAPSVVVDDYKGAYLATEHLVQQGYKRIAHIAGPKHVHIFQQRLKGYKDALEAYGCEVDKALVIQGNVSIESGKECMLRLLEGSRPPDAVFAVEDFTALGALQALKDKNIDCPGGTGLIGFANEPFGAYITPSLSTIDQQTTRMGEEAARLFFNAPAKDFYKEEPQKLLLDPVLVVRASSTRNQ